MLKSLQTIQEENARRTVVDDPKPAPKPVRRSVDTPPAKPAAPAAEPKPAAAPAPTTTIEPAPRLGSTSDPVLDFTEPKGGKHEPKLEPRPDFKFEVAPVTEDDALDANDFAGSADFQKLGKLMIRGKLDDKRMKAFLRVAAAKNPAFFGNLVKITKVISWQVVHVDATGKMYDEKQVAALKAIDSNLERFGVIETLARKEGGKWIFATDDEIAAYQAATE